MLLLSLISLNINSSNLCHSDCVSVVLRCCISVVCSIPALKTKKPWAYASAWITWQQKHPLAGPWLAYSWVWNPSSAARQLGRLRYELQPSYEADIPVTWHAHGIELFIMTTKMIKMIILMDIRAAKGTCSWKEHMLSWLTQNQG